MPVKPRPNQPPTPTPADGRGGAVGVAAKILAAIVLGAAAWLAWKEYRRRQTPPPEPVKDTPVIVKTPDVPVVVAPPPKPDEPPPPPPPPEPVPQDPVKPAPLAAIPSLEHPDALTALKASTLARLDDGRWTEHAALVRTAATSAVATRARSGGATQLDRLCEKGALPLAMAQLELLGKTGDKALSDWVKTSRAGDAKSDFAARLLTSPALMELLVNNLTEHDDVGLVLQRWSQLDAREPNPVARDNFTHLTLALALIYDKPGADREAAERHDYYRKQADAKKLLIQPAKIEPDELVWAVGPGAFPLSDANWAVKHLSLSLSNLGDAYGKVPYRMNHDPYPEYTMENVLRMGGICMNQSQFAESNARARGVPCAYVSGEGSRGGHAWFAYRGPRGWTNTTGRYHDGYACGMATNPQTRKSVREWDLLLYNDPGRGNGARTAAKRLSRATTLVSDPAEKLALLEAATQRHPGNPDNWKAWFDALLADKKDRPTEFWLKLVSDFRNEFKMTPDHFDASDRIEKERIFPRLGPDRIGEFLRNRRRQSLRQNPDRFDMLTDSVRREADYYKSIGDEKRIGTLYAGALREYGDNLPAYMRLAADFAELSKDNPTVRRAGMLVLESVYNKDVDTKLRGDTFALDMQSKVAARVADIFSAEGDEKKAAKYRERAGVIAAKSKELRDAMR